MSEVLGIDPEGVTPEEIDHFRTHFVQMQRPEEARTLVKAVLEPLENGRMEANPPGMRNLHHRKFCALVLMHAAEIRRVAALPDPPPKFSDAQVPGAKLARENAINALLSSGIRFSDLNDSTSDGRLKYLRAFGSYSELQKHMSDCSGGKLMSKDDMGSLFRSGHLVRADDLALGTGFDFFDLEVGSETPSAIRARQCVAEAEGIYMLEDGRIFLLSPGGEVGGIPETDQLGTLLVFREITGWYELWERRAA